MAGKDTALRALRGKNRGHLTDIYASLVNNVVSQRCVQISLNRDIFNKDLTHFSKGATGNH